MYTSGAHQYGHSALFTSNASQAVGSSSAKKSDNVSFPVKESLMDQKREGMEIFLEKVESDEKFAKKMVDLYKNTPDRPMFNLEEALSSPGGLSHIQDKAAQFNEEANKVSAQREEIYSSMRAENYDNAAIFKALMEFNNSLPAEYKQAAGIVKVDTQA